MHKIVAVGLLAVFAFLGALRADSARADQCSAGALTALLDQADVVVVATVVQNPIGFVGEAMLQSWEFPVEKTEILFGAGSVPPSFEVNAVPEALPGRTDEETWLKAGDRVILFLKRPAPSTRPHEENAFRVTNCFFGVQPYSSRLERAIQSAWTRQAGK